jgi:hypothetical protein
MVVNAPQSADPDFTEDFAPAEYTLKNEDNDISTLEVSDYDGNTLRGENTWTEETGLSTSFSLNIPSKGNPPTDDSTIAVTADMPTGGLLSTNKLVFTTSTYNQKQYITITGQDDDVMMLLTEHR